jgi:hypothetical protein
MLLPLLLLLLACISRCAADDRPHILLIVVDDLGWNGMAILILFLFS